MVSALGQNNPLGALAAQNSRNTAARNQSILQTAQTNPQANASRLIGGQNALGLIGSAGSTSGLLSGGNQQTGIANSAAGQLLGAQGVLPALRTANQLQIQQNFLEAEASGNPFVQQQDQSAQDQLVQRLIELDSDRLAILQEAARDNPSELVPDELARSFENFSEPELVQFRQAVSRALEIVTQREAQQAARQEQNSQGDDTNNSLGGLINTEV